MNDENSTSTEEAEDSSPQWRPLMREQRRVIGVLVEKAKTTPDAYPMTLNSLTSGCNQKSNRSPQMSIAADDVEVVLDELREMGAAVEVQGGGRVAKYRHKMYEWLGVDKTGIAVMAELLLRGEQTLGELRGRASRMEAIADMGEMRPVLDALEKKKLIVALTPEGRGQIITHGLYLEDELSRLQERYANQASAPVAAPRAPAPRDDSRVETLEQEVAELRSQLCELQGRIEKLEQMLN